MSEELASRIVGPKQPWYIMAGYRGLCGDCVVVLAKVLLQDLRPLSLTESVSP